MIAPERALDAYLDAKVTGTPALPETLDRATAETVERFFAADNVPSITPEAEARIWHEMLRSIEAAPRQPLAPRLMSLPAQDYSPIDPSQRLRSWRRGVRLRLAPLATAALVALMLLGSLVLIHGPSLPRPEEPVTISVGEPGRSLTTLAAAQVANWPEPGPLLRVTLRRETFAPGAVEEFGVPESTGDALDLVIVEAGVLTMEADGALTVWHSEPARSTPVVISAGAVVELQAGDQALSPSGVAVRRSNAGSDPAVILSVLMTQDELLTFPPGVTNVRYVPDVILNKPWPAPATLSLRHVQLQPDTMFQLRDLPGLQLLYVEEGAVDLLGSGRGDLVPAPWDSIPAGQGASYFETTTALANSGDEAATFLVVTVESDG